MELLNELDKKGIITGNILDREVIHSQGLWHREIAVWVFNPQGQVLVQRRSLNKKMNPGTLSICAGHVEANDDSISTAQRELFEEIGLKKSKSEIFYIVTEKKEKIFSKNSINRIFNDVYYVISDQKISDFKIQEEELSEIMWVNYQEFENRIITGDAKIGITYSPKTKKTFKLLDQIYCKITH